MTSDLDRPVDRGSSGAGFDEAIRALLARGWRFQQLHDDDGNVVALVGSYGWPDYDDRLHVYGEDEAIAARVATVARSDADEIVWSYQGDATTAIQALLELPKPHDPNAPRHSHRAPLGLWLPATGPVVPGLPPAWTRSTRLGLMTSTELRRGESR